MKDQALEIAKSGPTPRMAKNKLREYLQHVILRRLFELKLNKTLVFHGGSALRIIHGARRFSEDLDCHLIKPTSGFDFQEDLNSLNRGLQQNGYEVAYKKKMDKTVQSVFIKFMDLLYEANISPHRGEIISIKIEIDTNPPGGFQTSKSLVNLYFPFAILHHDKRTFLAGKLHAILQRSFIKGRDYFDLAFYLSRWPNIQPNFIYLNNALKQTNYLGLEVNKWNWKDLLLNRIHSLDWSLVKADIEPFIENDSDRSLVNKELITSLLSC